MVLAGRSGSVVPCSNENSSNNRKCCYRSVRCRLSGGPHLFRSLFRTWRRSRARLSSSSGELVTAVDFVFPGADNGCLRSFYQSLPYPGRDLHIRTKPLGSLFRELIGSRYLFSFWWRLMPRNSSWCTYVYMSLGVVFLMKNRGRTCVVRFN